jgi:Predicted hydrolase of the alpha/beta superfamily
MQTNYVEGNDTLVVLVTGNEENQDLVHAFPYSFLMVSSTDWNRELSPWPAKHVLKGGGDFQGEADIFLQDLCSLEELKKSWKQIIICGYSLAGLFSLYACTKTNLFDGCASVSGSLWYPDLIEYLKKNPVHCSSVYLSLGDLEKNSRQALLSTVEEKTNEVKEILSAYTSVRMEMNPGNHFNDPNGRIIRALKTFEQK